MARWFRRPKIAIDTQNKRRSVQGYNIGIMPVPDGTVGTADRATKAWLYAGLTYDVPVLIVALAHLYSSRFHLHHNLKPFN